MNVVNFASLLLISSAILLVHGSDHHHHKKHRKGPSRPVIRPALPPAPALDKEVPINSDSMRENKAARNMMSRQYHYFYANYCKPQFQHILSGIRKTFNDGSKNEIITVEICPDPESCSAGSLAESPCRSCTFDISEKASGITRTNKIECEDTA